MLRVGDEAGTHTEDELGIDLNVAVLVRVEQGHGESCRRPFPIRESDLRFEQGIVRIGLTEVDPCGVLMRQRPTGMIGSFGDGLGKVVRARCDEEVLLLIGVNPFHDALIEQVPEGHLIGFESLEMVGCQPQRSILLPGVEDQEWAKDATLVGVDEDLSVGDVVSNRGLGRDVAPTSSVLELLHEVLPALVDTVQVPIHMDSVPVGPIQRLLHIHVIEDGVDESLIDVL